MNSLVTAKAPKAMPGWIIEIERPPAPLCGANGMRFGPDGMLYVAQVFSSQVGAIDIASGSISDVLPVGGPVVGPDDIAFDSHGVMYMTEVMNKRVAVREPGGRLRVIAEDLPVANGITIESDRIFIDEFRPGGRLLEIFADGRAPRVIASDLVTPNGLAMGPDGALYFPQVAAGEIWRVSPDGGLPKRFISGLAAPTAVKFSPKGELHVVEAGSGDVARIDIQTATRTRVSTVRPGIDNLAFSTDGRLYISHYIDGGVAEIERDGHERVIARGGLLGPFGLSVAENGTLYVADGMSFAVFGANGSQNARPALLINADFPGFVRGIAAAPDGGCYLATSGGVVARYREDGTMVVLATSLGNLSGIAMSARGSLLACDTDGGCLLEITTTGKVSTIARGLDAPVSIAPLPDGSCYVSESAAGRVVHIANGSATAVIGGLQNPQGLAVLGDDLFVLDSDARTLLVHQGGRTTVVATDLAVLTGPVFAQHVLPGIDELLPGPLRPFPDLAPCPDGRILVGLNGNGSVVSVRADVSSAS